MMDLVSDINEHLGVDDASAASNVHPVPDIERITKRFYEQFSSELTIFGDAVDGLNSSDERLRYASLTLNRLMFVYFIQKRGLLNDEKEYLRHRLQKVAERRNERDDSDFYRSVLIPLFHLGLATPEASRPRDFADKFGHIPFLNGGVFEPHDLELSNRCIRVLDRAFERVFDFYDKYNWKLVRGGCQADNEVNPDILGYIFEKYVNQKQMGAYYTKSDITSYISRSTIVPFLFDAVNKTCPEIFGRDHGIARLLQRNDPDRYIFPELGHGIAWDVRSVHEPKRLRQPIELPRRIRAGIDEISLRGDWNQLATDEVALPTETWRDVISRRSKYATVREKLTSGAVMGINHHITLNLDVERFARDVIVQSEEATVLRSFWEAINGISILDPTCGSGAFLFAAINVLESLYESCLEAMRGFVCDVEPADGVAISDLGYFRRILRQVDAQPSTKYFVLKSIVLRNIYGVDIMPEAVEICKLRLFLVLIAQIGAQGHIEPLPDIDFNVRAGNALIGFTSLETMRRAIALTPSGQHRALFAEDLATLERIEKDAKSVGQAHDSFRWQQTMWDENASLNQKYGLNRRVERLSDELNRLLAKGYGIESTDDSAYGAWLDIYQPFHWFVEFYGIMAGGGFDVVIGNPPYIKTNAVEYDLYAYENHRVPDIYGYVLTKALTLRSGDGRCGFIVPLSVGFGKDFVELRQTLVSNGGNWFSFFDNIPAALFSGVSQRCTIWLNDAVGKGVYTTRLFRWRSSYRSSLMRTFDYTMVPDVARDAEFGIPRVSSEKETRLLSLHVTASRRMAPRKRTTRSMIPIGFSPTARNFISTYISTPPTFDANDNDLNRPLSKPPRDTMSNRRAFESLASTSGDACFWYWLTRSDGFHVTNWLLADYLAPLDSFSIEYLEQLRIVGELLHEYRSGALVFKKNAGKFVGNYNYQHLITLTRRADLAFVAGLGGEWGDAQHLFSFVKRVRSINKAAGERGIPVEIKDKYQAPDVMTLERDDRLLEMDSWLASRYRVPVERVKSATKH